MPADHLRETLERGTCSIEFHEDMMKSSRCVARERWVAKMKELSHDGKFTPGALEPYQLSGRKVLVP
eukprot:2070612-Pyramimonas_sp.AAC.1